MLYPPYPNELLSSWIIRNSIVQGSDPMGWVYGFWGEWRAWTRDIDRYLPKKRTIELARFSRLGLGDIQNMTLTPTITRIEGGTPPVNLAWKWVIPTGRRNRSIVGGLQFCPQCLNEKGGFFPREWRLSWHTQCDKHGVRLHDGCDRCAMPFSPHLIDYTAPHVHLCARCENDLRTLHSHPASGTVLLLQKRLEDILVSQDAVYKYYPQWELRTTKDFFLFLRDILVLSVILSSNKDRFEEWQLFLFSKIRFEQFLSKAGLSFDMRSVEERESLLMIAFHLLEHTPQYLVQSLRHIQLTQAIFNRQSFPHSPYMHQLLSTLPNPTLSRKKKIHTSMHSSKEPKTIEEVKKQMTTIKKFL